MPAHAHGVQAALDRIHATVADHSACLTCDIDCLDPAFAPGTGTPVPGGLSTAQALARLRELGEPDIGGMDIVEVAPNYDTSEITALAGATLAHDYPCRLAERKRSRDH